MAMELGVAVSLMEDAWWMPVTVSPSREYPYVVILEKALSHGVFVNSKGRRFTNEAEPYITVCQTMYTSNCPEAKCIPCWFVFDRAYRKKYPAGPMMAPMVPPSRRLIDSGYLRVGNTVEELARNCGIESRWIGRRSGEVQRLCRDRDGFGLQQRWR